MGFQRFTISEEEHKERSLKVISTPTNERNKDWANELFFLHNDRLTPRETGIGCGSCRKRVFDRLIKLYN